MKKIKFYFSSVLAFAKNHKIISAIGLVILIGLIWFLKPGSQTKILTEKVQKGKLTQTISITGSINAENIANLTFKTGGKLVYLGAREGDTVSAYQTIAVLDQRTVQKNLEQTLITYSEQRNTFDQTRDNYQNRTPDQALNDAMKRILQNNQYDLNKAIVSVELQDLAKQDSVVTTPISGIVTHEDVKQVGLNITALTTFTVVDPTSLDFEMDADEADVGKIKNGDKISVVLDAYPDQTLNLTVDNIDFVSHTTSTGGTAFKVRAKLQSSDISKFRIGMSGNADVTTNEINNVLSIPSSAILNGDKVYVLENGKFEERSVRTGLETDTRIEIKSGLREFDEVAIDTSKVKK